MGRTVEATPGPARLRVGLPMLPDGSARRPLLLRLPDGTGACNNGCRECVTRPAGGPAAAWTADAAGRHVVVRDREPTLRRDLPARIAELRARRPLSIALLTNGRMLAYPQLVQALCQAGVDRFVVKLFGLDAAVHDAHTRAAGAFAQACRGIETARAAGATVLVTFPCLDPAPGEPLDAAGGGPREARRALARALTGHDTVEFPEELVLAHDGGYGYDVVVRRQGVLAGAFAGQPDPFTRINTGPACNIRCTYCSVDGGTDQRLYDRAYVEALITDAARRGRAAPHAGGDPMLDFLGGEPTLHPDLPHLIAHARACGFPEIGICTNGLLLLKPGYLDRLVAAGLTTVNLSFHDHRPEGARALAAVGGYGGRCPEVGELLLARADVHVVFFRLLLASTLDAVPDYVRWIAARARPAPRPRRLDLHFGLPTVRGRMLAQPAEFPPLARVRPVLAEALALAAAHGIDAFVGPGPACLHPADLPRSQCLHFATVRANAVTGREESLRYDGETAYGRACADCWARAAGCGGLPATYFERDPDEAERWLRPVAPL